MQDSKVLFKESWSFVHKNYWKFLVLLAIPFIIQFIIGFISEAASDVPNVFLYGFIVIVTTLIMYIVNFSIAIAIFRYVEGKQRDDAYTIKKAFDFDWMLILHFFVLSIVVMLASLPGYILLVIPGIIISLLFGFSAFYVVLRNKKPFDSMVCSWRIISGRKWKFFVKALYPVIFWILLYIAGVVGMFIVALSSLALGMFSLLLMLFVGLGFVYFMVKIMASYYVYLYKLFIEFEKTAGEFTPEKEQVTRKIIKNWIVVGIVVAVVILIAAVIFLI